MDNQYIQKELVSAINRLAAAVEKLVEEKKKLKFVLCVEVTRRISRVHTRDGITINKVIYFVINATLRYGMRRIRSIIKEW